MRNYTNKIVQPYGEKPLTYKKEFDIVGYHDGLVDFIMFVHRPHSSRNEAVGGTITAAVAVQVAEALLEAARHKSTKKVRPHGPQEYRGSGNHQWEAISGAYTERLRVPGGWLYRTTNPYSAPTFVPMPEVVGYAI